MHKYCIGLIDSSTLPKQQEYTPPAISHSNPEKSSDFFLKVLQVTVPLALVGLSLSMVVFTKDRE